MMGLIGMLVLVQELVLGVMVIVIWEKEMKDYLLTLMEI